MHRVRVLAAVLFAVLLLVPDSRANGWQPLKNQARFNASTMFLLMDGRVFVNEWWSRRWFLLTPDDTGSYLNGTWSKAADAIDDRLYYASSVLSDGRVIVSGGEYSNTGGSNKTEIYDPVANTWTAVPSPAGWGYIGDAPSVVLADGRFLMGNIRDARVAVFDPTTDTWSPVAQKRNGTSVEETWTLLPDGTVVTPDCAGAPGSELYDPLLDVWVNLGKIPVNLVDSGLEIGPGLMLYDGTAFIIGATPTSAHYTPSATPGGVGTWRPGPEPPVKQGSRVRAKDAPCSILPNGNVLCALGHGFSPPTWFFEYDGQAFRDAPTPGNGGGIPYEGRFILLPTGEALFANNTIELYTCDGGPDPSWLPTITSVPTGLLRGGTYTVAGTQLNGLTTACSYGDECAVATNYPLVRLTFPATGHVTYCRAHDPGTMAIATGSALVTGTFDVPASADTGPAFLEVVANGNASAPVNVWVGDPTVIDFDALPTGVPVTNQYAMATFSAEPGYDAWTTAATGGSTPPNEIRSGPSAGGGVDGTHEIDVDFPCAVASLSLLATGVDDVGTVATVNVYQDGLLTTSVPVVGVGTPAVPVPVDLTGFDHVTRIELTGVTDTGGIGWDDFAFGVPSASAFNYGQGFPGTLGVPALTASAPPVLGTTISIDVGNSLGAATGALLLFGVSPTSVPTAAGGTLLVVPAYYLVLPVPAGGGSLNGAIPNDPTLCGLSIFIQGLELDPGAQKNLSFTPGLQLHFGD